MSRIGNLIRRRPVLSALAAGAVLIAGAGAVSAQYGGWGGQGGWRHHGGGDGRMGGRGGLQRMCGMETARWAPVARAWVKADLALTAPQAAEFDKLADVAHPAMEQVKTEVCGAFGPFAPRMTAPERLEKASQTMRKAADAMDKAVGPAKAFYNTLDDKQKARVEELMERRRMARGGRGMQHGGPGMGGMQHGGPGMGQPGAAPAPGATPPKP